MLCSMYIRRTVAGLLVAAMMFGFTTTVSSASIGSGTWTTLSPMNTARLAPFVTAIGGKLYVAGGTDGGALGTLERYDPLTDSWTTLSSMPTARYQGGVAAVGDKIYVLGGWNAPAGFIPTTTVQIYDTVTDSWSFGPSMPILSSSGPTGVINGKIYKHTAEHGFASPSQQLHVFDPVAGTWTALANLPADHGGGAAGVVNDKLYVASGWRWQGGTTVADAQVHAYDPLTNSWSTLTTGPTARAGVAGAVLDDHLFVAGGGNSTNPVLDVFEAYDVANDLWIALPSMPTAITGAGGAVIGDTFYVVGGNDINGTTNTLQAYTVPEPSTFAMAGVGLAAFLLHARRRRKVWRSGATSCMKST